MARISFYIFILIFSTCNVSYGQKNIEDELFPPAKIDTIYKISSTENQHDNTMVVKECGYYTLWEGLYPDGTLHFIKIFKHQQTFKQRKLTRSQYELISGHTNDDLYQLYVREMFSNGKLCTETYYDQDHNVKSHITNNKDGLIVSRKISNRIYFERFYDNGNRKNYSIPEMLYINWYENGQVSSMDIHELETIKFYSDGTLASYEKRGIPNVRYEWDALGEPVRIFYSANYYPQWDAPIQHSEMDSIKSMIEKQDWMTGLAKKFNPESFKLNHFENGTIKMEANFSDNPAANYMNTYDLSGQLFKVAADAGNRRSQTSIDYLEKYNTRYKVLMANPRLDSLWKVYRYNSKKLNEPGNLIEILLNKPHQYLKIQINEYDYKVVNEENNSETNPLQYISVYATNSPDIDTAKFNAVLKQKPFPADNQLFLQRVIEKLKRHTQLVIHRNIEECYECEYSYDPIIEKTYAFSDLSYNMNSLDYELTDLSIKAITLLGDHLVVEYQYFYSIYTDELKKAELSMREFYLMDLKTNSISSSISILDPTKKKDFEIYLHEKFKRLNLDSLQQKSILKEIVLLPRLQSFDLLIPADYQMCSDDVTMYEDQYINIDLNEIKPFLDTKHTLVQWMLSLPKDEANVFNRNQDIFEKDELEDFLQNGISSRLFKNMNVDTITISNAQFVRKYVFNKNRLLIYKESLDEYWAKTYFQYTTNGRLNKVSKIIGKNEDPAIMRTDWYFDNNSNLKTIIDSSVYSYGCQPQAYITHYYNAPDYSYVDKKIEKEKSFYKNGLLVGTLKEVLEPGYVHDTTFIKKIEIANSTSMLIDGFYYTYDKAGNLIKKQDQMGFSTYELQYDTNGRLLYHVHTRRNDEMSYFSDKTIRYQYDSNNRLKDMIIKHQSEFGNYEETYHIQYQ